MSEIKHRVAIIGCGRLGQHYAQAYLDYPDTEIVAIAEINPDRRKAVGERFGVSALYPDADALLKDVVPDIAAVVTPTKYMKAAVIACAEAGVKGVSTDKPIAAKLADADEMVKTCEDRGVVYAGGNLQRAMHEVQAAARRIHDGEFGPLLGACVHGYGGEISGGGCQHIAVLRLFTGAEVSEVTAWGQPEEAVDKEDDGGLIINGLFRLSNGLACPVFGTTTPNRGVDVWTEEALIRWDWDPPRIFRGFDASGARIEIDPGYEPYEFSEHYYLTGSIRSFLAAVETGSELWISGHDLRQSLEVPIACKVSAQRGNIPIKLPLEDRTLSLRPTSYRWAGGDATDSPQTVEEVAHGKNTVR